MVIGFGKCGTGMMVGVDIGDGGPVTGLEVPCFHVLVCVGDLRRQLLMPC